MLSRDDLERELRLLRDKSDLVEFAVEIRFLAATLSRGTAGMRETLEWLLVMHSETFAAVIAELKAEGKIPTRKRGPKPKDDPAWLMACFKHSRQSQADFLKSFAPMVSNGPDDDPYARLEKTLTNAKRAYRTDHKFRADVDGLVEVINRQLRKV